MQYVGGKSKVARRLASAMLGRTTDRSHYVEPFVGGGAVLGEMAPHFDSAVASDIHPDLICLFRAVEAGWKPPDDVTEAEYHWLKGNKSPSAMRGFVGFACAFGGKFFRGYARNNSGTNYAAQGQRSLLKLAPKIKGVEFAQCSYERTVIPDAAVVYCDPPYADAQKVENLYKTVGMFDHAAFWAWATDLSARCTVFVSEYVAPAGWVSIWEREQTGTLAGAKFGYKKAIEHLFVYAPSHAD